MTADTPDLTPESVERLDLDAISRWMTSPKTNHTLAGAMSRLSGALAEIARLSVELAAVRAERGWQPIDTAPKDGTLIIGGIPSAPWAEAHLIEHIVKCWWQPEFDAYISSCREMTLADGLAFEDGTSRRLHSPVCHPVTHWMPLPAAPAAHDRGEG